MAYIINKTDGTTLTIINDFEINNTSTSLKLIGKGYKDWGEHINENFVKLIENFANSTPPPNPLNGQLWYDTSNNTLKIYNSITNNWNSLQINIEDLNFYYQKILTPTSGFITGFINSNKIIGLFSDIRVSADKLDDGSLFPFVNAQNDFPNGTDAGLNLSNMASHIRGQNSLTLGIINSVSSLASLEIDINGKIYIKYDLESKNTTTLERVLISGQNPIRPRYYLPTSAGNNNDILVSQGNNNNLVWKNVNDILINDKIEGYSGSDYVLINASSPSQGIEFFTKNKLRMVIDENGNLGLGTSTNPYYRIHVENDVSSNNVSLGLINIDPSQDTSINLITYFDTGNSANINFFRGGSNLNPILPGETLGSINWYGINNSGDMQNTVKVRSVVVTANPSTISCNLEFLNSDVSGFYKCFEINEKGEILIYYDRGNDYYILPTSGGSQGQFLISDYPNKKLVWKDLTFYNQEILLTSFPLVGLDSITTKDLQPNSKRIIYLYGFSPQTTSRFLHVLFLNNGGNSYGTGYYVQFEKGGTFVRTSARNDGRLMRSSLGLNQKYFAKIVINLDISSKVLMCCDIFDNTAEVRCLSFFSNSGSSFTECTSVQLFLNGSALFSRGSAKIVDIINPTPPFMIS